MLSHRRRRCDNIKLTLAQGHPKGIRAYQNKLHVHGNYEPGTNVGLILGQGRKRWDNIKPVLTQPPLFADVGSVLVRGWASVTYVGQTLNCSLCSRSLRASSCSLCVGQSSKHRYANYTNVGAALEPIQFR